MRYETCVLLENIICFNFFLVGIILENINIRDVKLVSFWKIINFLKYNKFNHCLPEFCNFVMVTTVLKKVQSLTKGSSATSIG
jgi:hypothetical protein